MKMQRLLLTILFLFSGQALAMPQAQMNDSLDKVLSRYVSNGTVDYKTLKTNTTDLDRYLAAAAKISKADFAKWSTDEQMAFYINLYNAATLKHIIKHYPVTSIKKIGGWFTSPWKIKFITLFGKKVHLDHIEHEILRVKYSDARIHFALVCAAKSCPPLRAEAYRGATLSAQLDDQGRIFLSDRTKNRVSMVEHRLYLSKIFDWFEKDFVKHSGSVQRFVAPYVPLGGKPANIVHDYAIDHLSYDWSLNE